jgi:hypothetical protein
MKNKILIFVLILFPFFIFSQSREYRKIIKSEQFKFLTDTYSPLHKKVSEIVNLGIENNYQLIKNKSTNEIFFKNSDGFNSVYMEKKIDNDDYFPNYSHGFIYKMIWFNGSIENARVNKIITEIILHKYSNVSSKQIKTFYDKIENFLIDDIRINNKISSKINSISNPFEDFTLRPSLYSLGKKIEYSNGEKTDVFEKKIFKSSRAIQYKDDSFYFIFNHSTYMLEDLLEFSKELTTFSNKSNVNKKKTLDNLRFNIGNKNLKDVNVYDLKEMVNLFLEDCKLNNLNVPKVQNITSTFEPLEDGVLALAFGMNKDNEIIIKVNPKEWSKATNEKRWYILYHELGHDVLNLEHGEGGKMMFNFADKDYSWDEFFTDKEYMFKSLN